MDMKITGIGVIKKLHARLNDGIDVLMTTKNHLESFQRDLDATVMVQLKSAKANLREKQKGIRDTMRKTEKLGEAKKEETVEKVAGWKAKCNGKNLEKRSKRAEEYADASVALALYYAAEAELAILEAITARQDVETSK